MSTLWEDNINQKEGEMGLLRIELIEPRLRETAGLVSAYQRTNVTAIEAICGERSRTMEVEVIRERKVKSEVQKETGSS